MSNSGAECISVLLIIIDNTESKQFIPHKALLEAPYFGSLLNVVVYPPREHLALQAVECLSAREFLKLASLKRKKFTGGRTRPFPACSAKVRLGGHTTSVCSTTSDIEPIFCSSRNISRKSYMDNTTRVFEMS